MCWYSKLVYRKCCMAHIWPDTTRRKLRPLPMLQRLFVKKYLKLSLLLSQNIFCLTCQDDSVPSSFKILISVTLNGPNLTNVLCTEPQIYLKISQLTYLSLYCNIGCIYNKRETLIYRNCFSDESVISKGAGVPMINCDHEEAEARIMVHFTDSLQRGGTDILVRTVDTDVVSILIA